MATNQVKDSKNNNAEYAPSFDSEKVDAKTISEMSKKADSGDALLFANKMTNKGDSGNGGKEGFITYTGEGSKSGTFSQGGFGTFNGAEGNSKPGFTLGSEGSKSGVFGQGGFSAFNGAGEGSKPGFTLGSDVGKSVIGISDASVGNSNAENSSVFQENKGDAKINNDDIDVERGESQQSGTIAYGGNVILDTIAAQRTYVEPIEAASTIRDIGVEVANEILATREALNAKQEVRIMLKDSVLKDTEVFVVKDGKSLSVSFVTGASESADILSQRSGDLRTQLMEKLDDVDFVDIQVEDNTQSDAENQNQDGRSQNRFGNEDQSQDDDQ